MARRKNPIQILENPLGMPLQRGMKAVIVNNVRRRKGSKKAPSRRVHLYNPQTALALCGAGRGLHTKGPNKGFVKGVKPSKAKNIDCYRCIKMHVVEDGYDYERKLRGEKRLTHMMIPGGREGSFVSSKHLPSDPAGLMFLGGTLEHPTQPRLLTLSQKAKRRADIRKGKSKISQKGRNIRAQGEMVANPRSYKLGYKGGALAYRTNPMSPSTLRNRSMSYQEGYLEGYTAAAKKNRRNPRDRSEGATMDRFIARHNIDVDKLNSQFNGELYTDGDVMEVLLEMTPSQLKKLKRSVPRRAKRRHF
jgi:hypothetical protein